MKKKWVDHNPVDRDEIKKLEENGAAAVVLKSIFEEEITLEYEKIVAEEAPKRYKDEFLDYLDYRIKDENIKQYKIQTIW